MPTGVPGGAGLGLRPWQRPSAAPRAAEPSHDGTTGHGACLAAPPTTGPSQARSPRVFDRWQPGAQFHGASVPPVPGTLRSRPRSVPTPSPPRWGTTPPPKPRSTSGPPQAPTLVPLSYPTTHGEHHRYPHSSPQLGIERGSSGRDQGVQHGSAAPRPLAEDPAMRAGPGVKPVREWAPAMPRDALIALQAVRTVPMPSGPPDAATGPLRARRRLSLARSPESRCARSAFTDSPSSHEFRPIFRVASDPPPTNQGDQPRGSPARSPPARSPRPARALITATSPRRPERATPPIETRTAPTSGGRIHSMALSLIACRTRSPYKNAENTASIEPIPGRPQSPTHRHRSPRLCPQLFHLSYPQSGLYRATKGISRYVRGQTWAMRVFHVKHPGGRGSPDIPGLPPSFFRRPPSSSRPELEQRGHASRPSPDGRYPQSVHRPTRGFHSLWGDL